MKTNSTNCRLRILLPVLTLLFCSGALTALSEDGNTRSTATWILPGTRSASLTSGDIDYFRFTVTQTGQIAIFSEGFVDVRATLYDEGGNRVDSDDQGGAENNFFLDRQINAGTYFIEVQSGFAINALKTGNYSMTLRTQESAPFITGSSLPGELRPGSADFYRITVGQAGLFETYTTGTTNTGGFVYNEVGTFVGSHDVQGHANFHFVRERFQPGTYLLIVKGGGRYSYSPPASGTYEVFVLRPELAETLTESPMDRILDPLGDVDHFTFVVPEYGSVRFWSTGFTDTRCQLYDSVGGYVSGSANSDSGDGYNFYRAMNLQPGRYYLRVSGESSGNPRGAYQIHLDLPGPEGELRASIIAQISATKRAFKNAKKNGKSAKARNLKKNLGKLTRSLRSL